MSFAVETEKPNNKRITFVEFRPRIRVTNWTLHDGPTNTWKAPWTRRLGNPPAEGVFDQSSFSSAVNVGSIAAVMASYPGTAAYYWTGEEIYLSIPAGNPNIRVVVVQWAERIASDFVNWYEVPNNSATTEIEWRGCLLSHPKIVQDISDIIFGFAPTQASQLVFANDQNYFTELLHEWSLYGAAVKVFHCIGELDTANTEEVFRGTAENYSYDQKTNTIRVRVKDAFELLEEKFPEQFFDLATFPNIEPASIGLPIRKVYGLVNGFRAVNIDYNDTPSTTVNRDWVVSREQAGKAQLVTTISSGTNNTSVVADASGFSIGDSIVVEQGGFPTYDIFVSSVNYATNTITHTNIPARVIVVGDEIRRGYIAAIQIFDGANLWNLSYERDWTETNTASDTKGFTLADNFEANHVGFPTPFDPSQHILSIDVYGSTVAPKRLDNVTDFGAVSDNGGAIMHPVTILWDLLRFGSSQLDLVMTLDETQFLAVLGSFTREVGFSIPETSSGSFPSWKEIITKVLQSELLRLHVKNGSEAMFTITQVGPTGTEDATADAEKFHDRSFSWDYGDTYSSVRMLYGRRELTWSGMEQQYVTSPGLDINTLTAYRTALYLHRIVKEYQGELLHFDAIQADLIANRYLYFLHQRRGIVEFRAPREFLTSNLDDDILVQAESLPGFARDGQIKERAFRLTGIEKAGESVSITLDDQKGVEDFSGSW